MTSRALALFFLVGLAACRGEQSTLTDPQSPGAPSFVISDGTKSGGNPDFFFRPPMVADPSGDADYTPGGFNPNLSPTVTVCPLSAAADDDVSAGTPCASAEGAIGPVVLDAPNEQYQVDWTVPRSTNNYYRIFVYLGAAGTSTLLGIADVKTAKGSNTPDFVVRKDGSILPIKFRIEGPCTSGVCQGYVNLQTGGTVNFGSVGGVEFPPGNAGDPITVTIQLCGTGNLGIDLPLFGSCLTITTSNETLELTVPATVFVCDAEPPAEGLAPAQRALVTLHRRDGSDVHALPHATHACPEPPPVITSVKGLIRALVHREWKSARGQLFGLLAPKPLYARRLDVGPGGRTFEFSDFQFALPAYMEIVAATDNQFALPGATLPTDPTVVVKDLNGNPVGGATVRFLVQTGGGTPSIEVPVLSNPVTGVASDDGLAFTSWVLGAVAGINTLQASGVGIAAANANGPRGGVAVVDPFMPLSLAFGDGSDGTEVLLSTGAVTFTATGAAVGTLPADYGSGDWYYQIDGTVPANWYSSAVFPFTTAGIAAFGSPSGSVSCALNNGAIGTSWPSGTGESFSTTLYARKFFTVSAGGAAVTIKVAIDNDVQVFLDGVDITATNEQSQVPVGGLLVHEGCPTQNSFTFTTSVLSAGTHLLAIRALDRGTSSYFDAEIKVAPPPIL